MVVQSAPAVYLDQPPNFQSKERREEVGKEIILARGCKERKRRRGKKGEGCKAWKTGDQDWTLGVHAARGPQY